MACLETAPFSATPLLGIKQPPTDLIKFLLDSRFACQQ